MASMFLAFWLSGGKCSVEEMSRDERGGYSHSVYLFGYSGKERPGASVERRSLSSSLSHPVTHGEPAPPNVPTKEDVDPKLDRLHIA